MRRIKRNEEREKFAPPPPKKKKKPEQPLSVKASKVRLFLFRVLGVGIYIVAVGVFSSLLKPININLVAVTLPWLINLLKRIR